MSHTLKLSPSLWCIKLVGNSQTFPPLAASHRSRKRFKIADKISARYEDEFKNKKQLDKFTILMLISEVTMTTTPATYKVLRKLLCMEALPLGCDGYQILRVAADLNIWQVGRKKWRKLSIGSLASRVLMAFRLSKLLSFCLLLQFLYCFICLQFTHLPRVIMAFSLSTVILFSFFL